jgi:parallel beta-helix repeat protein
MKTYLFAALFILCAVTSNATTYYVSNTGDNENNGSQSDPWETIQHAVGQVHAGDSVIILSGEYVGFCMGWDDENEGTSSDPIVFKANAGAIIISDNINTNDGINLEGVSYIIVDGFTIANPGGSITRAGIRSVGNTGVVIRNNTIDGMGTWGIFTGFSDNILIENNHCSNSIEEHGIYFSNSADNPVIRGNTSFGNNGCGIHMNGDISMGGDGIISNALVEGNIIYDNGSDGGSAINCDGVQNSTIRNNLIYNNHSSGISLYQIDAAEPAFNNKIINNTIVMPNDGRWALNIGDGSSGNTVLNNIMFSYHSFRGGLVIDQASLSGFTSDYNIVVDRFSPDGDATIQSLEEWQEATGQDEHSYVSSPEDVFAGMDDFHLKDGCLAIDNGTSNHAPSTDIEGRTRPWGNGFDMGAYEFGAPVYIPEKGAKEEILVFPNPVRGECLVKSKEHILSVEIIDMNGRVLIRQRGDDLNKVLINTRSLKQGIYILRVNTKAGQSQTTICKE